MDYCEVGCNMTVLVLVGILGAVVLGAWAWHDIADALWLSECVSACDGHVAEAEGRTFSTPALCSCKEE